MKGEVVDVWGAINFTAVRVWFKHKVLRLSQTDTLLLLLGLVLGAVSCVTLYSANQEQIDLVQRQIHHLFIGFALLLILALQPKRLFLEAAPWLYVIGLILLGAVLLFGDEAKGAQRWLDLRIIRFQPSELLKVVTPLMLCFIYHTLSAPRAVRHVLAVVALSVPVALVVFQPDFGTALLIALSGCFVIFFAGVHWAVIVSIFVAVGAAMPLIWHNMLAYQRQRVMTFLEPERDPLGAGYHALQAKIAVGSGGLQGKGWLNGTQSQLEFVPERTTDFVSAVVAEEFGFIGMCFLIVIYTLIAFRGLFIALRATDPFCLLLAGGLSLSFFLYVFANIGMVIGLLPIVGTTLPLISYGGTSIVMVCALLGILMALSRPEPTLMRTPTI